MVERFDSFVGTVIATNSKGCYVESKEAIPMVKGFYFGGGNVGDLVLVSVKNTRDPNSLLFSLDSVLEYAPLISGYVRTA